jgi:hypothetical protein
MCRLDFSPQHLDLAIISNDALGDVERVVVIFRKAETHVYVVLSSAVADAFHLWRLHFERIFEVSDSEI